MQELINEAISCVYEQGRKYHIIKEGKTYKLISDYKHKKISEDIKIGKIETFRYKIIKTFKPI